MNKILFLLLTVSISSFAQKSQPKNWGIGFGQRTATIPYKASEDTVSDIIPLFYYERGDFELNGLEARFSFFKYNQSKLNLVTKYRFYDIPKELQNETRRSGFDYGLEYEFGHSDFWHTRAQFLTDSSTRPYFNIETESDHIWSIIHYRPYAYLTVRGKEFNKSYYYNDHIGYEIGAGVKATIKVYENFHLLAQAKLSALDPKTRDQNEIDKQVNYETFFGISFLDQSTHQKKQDKYKNISKLKSRDFFRVTYAQATPSNLSDILSFHTAWDKYENDMVSLSYGIPLSDTFMGSEVPVYLLPTYVQHLSSNQQSSISEYVLAVKIYIPFYWPVKWRLGLAEGISYLDEITYIEEVDIAGKGYRGSKWMNYLDFSLDISLEKLGFKDTWAGIMIHHRSSIFESSSLFGRIKGGSNYIGLFLQQEL